MERFDKFFAKLEEFLLFWICCPIFVVMMFYVTINVFGRYFFQFPAPRMWEIVGALMIPMIFLVMAYGWRTGTTFLDVRFISDKLGPKYNAFLVYLNHIIGIFIFGGIMGYANYKDTFWALDTKDAIGAYSTAVPTWPLRIIISFSCLLLIIRCATDLIKIISHRQAAAQKAALGDIG
jgi:TRAP-type C4-dicarboxylate transport system permease small subunit